MVLILFRFNNLTTIMIYPSSRVLLIFYSRDKTFLVEALSGSAATSSISTAASALGSCAAATHVRAYFTMLAKKHEKTNELTFPTKRGHTGLGVPEKTSR